MSKASAAMSKALTTSATMMSTAYEAYSKASDDEDHTIKNIKKYCSKDTLKILQI